MFLLSSLKRLYVKRQIAKEQKQEEYLVLKNFTPDNLEPLTENEKKQVSNFLGDGDYKELGLFKKFNGFDPRYIPHRFYLPVLAHKLNDYQYTKLFEHKSLLGVLTKGNLHFPYCYVRKINGEYYSDNMNQLTEDNAIKGCLSADCLIVKDSVNSSGGKSIEKISLQNLSESEKRNILKRVFTERKQDFVIQECVEQSLVMSEFNQTSINTIRVTTLYLNGIFSILTIVLRIGKNGMTVDNWGAGGILISVSHDGKLNDFGYDKTLKKFYDNNGFVFKGKQIPQIPNLLKLLESEHKYNYSLCKLIGWDVCFNKDNEPVIIELNSSQPGLIGEQLSHGPIFGDRTQEVLDYCKNKKFNYNRSILKY